MASLTSANVLPFDRKTPPFERRRYDRVSAPNVRARPGSDRLEILDMSQRGMAIKAVHPFSVGGSYIFELQEDDRSLMIEGEIRWCERQPLPQREFEIEPAPVFCTGVAFVGIQNQTSIAGAEEISQISRMAPEPEEDADQIIAHKIDLLRQSGSADEAAELLLEILSVDFAHLVLFRLKGDEIKAWMGRGPTLVPDRLVKLRLGAHRASVFLHLQQGGSFFYGQLPAMFAHLQLLRCWHGSLDRECAVFPVRINARLVAFLYADTGGRSLLPQHLATLKKATDLFARSLLDQILRRKARAQENSD